MSLIGSPERFPGSRPRWLIIRVRQKIAIRSKTQPTCQWKPGVGTWQEAAPELEAIRRKEVREADNLHVPELLEEAFNHALRALPCRPSSGMVQMQEYVAKLPR
jgi:hypothetical protein